MIALDILMKKEGISSSATFTIVVRGIVKRFYIISVNSWDMKQQGKINQ